MDRNVNASVDSYIAMIHKQPLIKLVEKYLQISDFIEYILDNRDLFIESQLVHVQNIEGEMKIFTDFLKRFLLNVQGSINFDKTVKVLIDNKVQQMVIDELFEQTDEAMKTSEQDEQQAHL